MRKSDLVFCTKFISETGSHLSNGDFFAFVEAEDYCCYCIADGFDENKNKESAKIAVTEALTAFQESPGCSRRLAKRYIQRAHKALLRESEETPLAVSMAIFLSDYEKTIWINAGDTRMDLIRDEHIRWKTKDIHSYLGQKGKLKPVTYLKKDLKQGDIIIMNTSGAWKSIENAELLKIAEKAQTPADVCVALEDLVLSRQQDVVDNYTIVTIFVEEG